MVMKETAVVFAQVPLLKSQLDELKRRSGMTTTKDALQTAVNHYLNCSLIPEEAEGKEREAQKKDWWWSPPPSEKEERR